MTLKSIFAAVAMVLCVGHAGAAGTLIPGTASAKDMVYDAQRQLIYITIANHVLRYNVATGQFLSPITLGHNLYGVDLSPDGTILAVADATYQEINFVPTIWVHLVSLSTLVDHKRTFTSTPPLPLGFEGGTWAVAWGGNGDLVVTEMTTMGSGALPTRYYTAATNKWGTFAPMSEQSMVATSGNGNVFAFAQPNNSGGFWNTFNMLSKAFATNLANTYLREVGISAGGSQVAVITSTNKALVYTNGVNSGGSIQAVGGVYDPVQPIAYFAQPNASTVIRYYAGSLAPTGSYDFNTTFQNSGIYAFGNGRMRISLDGSLLMAIGNDGVHYLQLYAPLKAANVAATTTVGKSVTLTGAGSIGTPSGFRYAVPKQPAHGTATVNGNLVTYVPASGFSGTDTFTYQALYGRASANGTMSVTVNPAESVLVAADSTMTVHQFTPVLVPVLANCRGAAGLALSIVVVKQPQHGSAAIQSNQILYTPAHTLDSLETIEYTVSDGHGRMATAHATIRVTDVRQGP